MPKNEQQEEISWEEAVSRYLGENPDFFSHHPDLLVDITIPHADTDGAVSLIERQVDVLRDQNRQLERQLRELISNARENEVLSGRLHTFARQLLCANTLDAVFHTALTDLQQAFHLDAVSIRIARTDLAHRSAPEMVAEDDEQFMQLALLVADGAPVCGGFLDQAQKDFLFGDEKVDVKSCALMPVKTENIRGIFCLGSQDPHRFEKNMATDYLAHLGDLIACAIERQRIS